MSHAQYPSFVCTVCFMPAVVSYNSATGEYRDTWEYIVKCHGVEYSARIHRSELKKHSSWEWDDEHAKFLIASRIGNHPLFVPQTPAISKVRLKRQSKW